MLVAGFFLVSLSRSPKWWARVGILVPAAVGGLASLGILVRLLATGGNRTSTLSVMLLLLWIFAAGYVAAQGFQDRLGTPPPKSWRSGLAALVGYAMMAPLPTAVGRALFAPELRDMAVSLQGNTVALPAVGTVDHQHAMALPERADSRGVPLGAVPLVAAAPRNPGHRSADRHGGDADHHQCVRPDGGPAGRRPDDPARPGQPGRRARALVRGLGTTPEQPPRADAHPGRDRCRMSDGDHLRGLPAAVHRDSGRIAVAHRGTDPGEPADRRREVGALYGDIVVVAATDRLDRAPTSLLGLRITDGAEAWKMSCEDLTVRFALVPAGDDPAKGHITEEGENVPQVLVGCPGVSRSLDPQTGKDRT